MATLPRLNPLKAKFAKPDFRVFLNDELKRRSRKNPNYSLRSFATFLELSPSFLSKLLNGKRPLTEATLKKLSNKLGLAAAEIEYYRGAFANFAGAELKSLAHFRKVELDQFSFISDWYHFAILELVALPDFDSSPKWIAKQLGLSVAEARAAIDRLIRLGFLAADAKGRLSNKSGNHTTIGPEIATSATRKQQKQILEMAIEALDKTSIEERSQTSVTMAIARSRLPEARKLIADFRRTLTSLMQDPTSEIDPDSVYQLSVSFYPITPTVSRKDIP